MIDEQVYECEPDFAIPPGETLLETIEELGISQAELAKRTGRPTKTINEIIKGKTRITSETSLQFEKVLGIPSSFWNNLEKDYRESLARENEKENLRNSIHWLKEFPVKELIERGWIEKKENKVEQLSELFSFFGVASISSWQEFWEPQVSFRKSPSLESNKYSVISYLRKAELEAQKVKCSPFDRERFSEVAKELRSLTKEVNPETFIPIMEEKCSSAGVALVLLPEINGAKSTKLSGATKWLESQKAMIVLSARHKTNDHLWFTFFHEAGHVLLHNRKETFLEYNNKTDEEEKEQEANEFAADILIPPEEYEQFIENRPYFSKAKVVRFSERIGVHPGIVVGRLQKDGYLPYSHLTKLKVKYTWKTDD